MSKDISLYIVDREGTQHVLPTPTDVDLNLMELCRAYELPVEGICGGMALCASCHVYVTSDHELPTPSESEEDMLDQAFFVEDNSRLACQIKITEDIAELRCTLAPIDSDTMSI